MKTPETERKSNYSDFFVDKSFQKMNPQRCFWLRINEVLRFPDLCLTEFITRPENTENIRSKRMKIREQEEVGLESPYSNGKHIATLVYNIFGEFPAFITGWLDVLVNLTVVSACRYQYMHGMTVSRHKTFFSSSRAVTATLDKTTENRLHDLVLAKFGMTPYLNTYPDFMAGAAVMIVALFIAAGFDVKVFVEFLQCFFFHFFFAALEDNATLGERSYLFRFGYRNCRWFVGRRLESLLRPVFSA